MRVVHLLSDLLFGGKERVALELAARARAGGDDHQLLLFDVPPDDGATCLAPGDIPWTFLPRRGGLDRRFARDLAAWLREHRVEVVHAHNDSAIVYAALAARRAGVRVVGTFHTRPTHRTLAGRLACRWACGHADVVTCVSPDLAQDLRAWGWLRRAEVLWNGVDTERFHPEGPRRERVGGGLVVGNVARFHPVKRQLDLFEAARRARESYPIQIVCVGQGPTRAEFEARTRGEDWVHVIDREHDVPALLRSIDLFALTSSEECAPLVLLEAMASGLPSVVTDAGGSCTMIDADGAAPGGACVAVGDVDALAASLASLAGDPARRARLGANARKRALEHYSREQEWSAYRARYARP